MPDWGPESLATQNHQEWTVNFKRRKENQGSLLSVESGLTGKGEAQQGLGGEMHAQSGPIRLQPLCQHSPSKLTDPRPTRQVRWPTSCPTPRALPSHKRGVNAPQVHLPPHRLWDPTLRAPLLSDRSPGHFRCHPQASSPRPPITLPATLRPWGALPRCRPSLFLPGYQHSFSSELFSLAGIPQLRHLRKPSETAPFPKPTCVVSPKTVQLEGLK